jgi:hypothetical protein
MKAKSTLRIVVGLAIASTLGVSPVGATDLNLPYVGTFDTVPLSASGVTYSTGLPAPNDVESRDFKYLVRANMVDAPIVVVLHGGVSSYPPEDTLLVQQNQPAFLGRLADTNEFSNTAFVAIRGTTPVGNGLTGHRYVTSEASKSAAETYIDVELIRQVIRDLRDTFPSNVSSNEEYLVGFSAGAGLIQTIICVDGLGYEGFAMMGLALGEVRSQDCGNTQSHTGYVALTGNSPKKYGRISDPADNAVIRRGKIYYYIGLRDQRINMYESNSYYSKGLLRMMSNLTMKNGVTNAYSAMTLDANLNDGYVTERREYSTPVNEPAYKVRRVRIAYTDNAATHAQRAGMRFNDQSAFPQSTRACGGPSNNCTPDSFQTAAQYEADHGLVAGAGGHCVPDLQNAVCTSDFNIAIELADFFGWH